MFEFERGHASVVQLLFSKSHTPLLARPSWRSFDSPFILHRCIFLLGARSRKFGMFSGFDTYACVLDSVPERILSPEKISEYDRPSSI